MDRKNLRENFIWCVYMKYIMIKGFRGLNSCYFFYRSSMRLGWFAFTKSNTTLRLKVSILHNDSFMSLKINCKTLHTHKFHSIVYARSQLHSSQYFYNSSPSHLKIKFAILIYVTKKYFLPIYFLCFKIMK